MENWGWGDEKEWLWGIGMAGRGRWKARRRQKGKGRMPQDILRMFLSVFRDARLRVLAASGVRCASWGCLGRASARGFCCPAAPGCPQGVYPVHWGIPLGPPGDPPGIFWGDPLGNLPRDLPGVPRNTGGAPWEHPGRSPKGLPGGG